jgi:hypothetical protein
MNDVESSRSSAGDLVKQINQDPFGFQRKFSSDLDRYYQSRK